MQSHTVRRITSAQAALSLHSLTTRHLTARPSSLHQAGGSVSSRRQIQVQRLSNGTFTLLCPRLALLLRLMLIAGLASCGPASSDNAPVLASRANVAG
jgi:hypothetical protein